MPSKHHGQASGAHEQSAATAARLSSTSPTEARGTSGTGGSTKRQPRDADADPAPGAAGRTCGDERRGCGDGDDAESRRCALLVDRRRGSSCCWDVVGRIEARHDGRKNDLLYSSVLLHPGQWRNQETDLLDRILVGGREAWKREREGGKERGRTFEMNLRDDLGEREPYHNGPDVNYN